MNNIQEEFEKGARVFDRTSILLTRAHDSNTPSTECSYCKGKRNVINEQGKEVVETDNMYYKEGFTCTKMRIDDYDNVMNAGYTRCGSYFYKKANHRCCCEIFQYRVDVNQFKINSQQKKAVRRFHRYLNYGKDQDNKNIEEEKKPEEVKDPKLKVINEVQNWIETVLNVKNDKHKVVFNQKRKQLTSNMLQLSAKDRGCLNMVFRQDTTEKTIKIL